MAGESGDGTLSLERELVIPAGESGAFIIKAGQVCRVIALDGEQCLDAVFLNANDHRERFHTYFSYSFNCKLGTGDAFHCKTLFSGPPWERPMLTVLEDTVKPARTTNPCATTTSRSRSASRSSIRGRWRREPEAVQLR
jgi:uncharacterized protein YcgI (DUF1989 family)